MPDSYSYIKPTWIRRVELINRVDDKSTGWTETEEGDRLAILALCRLVLITMIDKNYSTAYIRRARGDPIWTSLSAAATWFEGKIDYNFDDWIGGVIGGFANFPIAMITVELIAPFT